MSKPYDSNSPNPSRVVELLRRLGRRDSGQMPAAVEPTDGDSGSGPLPVPDGDGTDPQR